MGATPTSSCATAAGKSHSCRGPTTTSSAPELSEGPLGSALGDLLVRLPSASGRGSGTGRSIPFEIDNGRELVGLTHFDLLNHPDVYEEIRRWIAAAVRT